MERLARGADRRVGGNGSGWRWRVAGEIQPVPLSPGTTGLTRRPGDRCIGRHGCPRDMLTVTGDVAGPGGSCWPRSRGARREPARREGRARRRRRGMAWSPGGPSIRVIRDARPGSAARGPAWRLRRSLDLAARLDKREASYRDRAEMMALEPRVEIVPDASATATVVEVRTYDRPAACSGWPPAWLSPVWISGGPRTTWGRNVVDVFYVRTGEVTSWTRTRRMRWSNAWWTWAGADRAGSTLDIRTSEPGARGTVVRVTV